MKEKLEKQNFNIGICESGVHCYYNEEQTYFYLRKDGTLKKYYDGDFFPNVTEAAKFLDEWLAKEFRPKVSRKEVANYFDVSIDFELID